jgi:hypothetical protein
MLMHISTTLVLAVANKYDIFFISLTDANKFPPVGAESFSPENSTKTKHRQTLKFDQAVDIQDETSPNLKTAFYTPLPSRCLSHREP